MSKTVKTGFVPRVVSHSEAIQNPALHNRRVKKGLTKPYAVDGVEQVVENGVIVKKSTVNTFDPVANMKGFKATDFALENIIAVGALDSLKESSLTIGTVSELSDSLEGTFDNIIAAVDDAELDFEPQNND